jgi:hypothetical protein
MVAYRPPRRRLKHQARPTPLVVERTIPWLLRFKRLGLRYDRTRKTLTPLLTLAMVLINLRRMVDHKLWNQVLGRRRAALRSPGRLGQPGFALLPVGVREDCAFAELVNQFGEP